jgi:hypothetical protein
MPLGKIIISPQIEDIFKNLKFRQTCRITLEVVLNRLAIRTQVEAQEHLEELVSHVETLKRAHAALLDLKNQENQKVELNGVINHLKGFFTSGEKQHNIRDLKENWDVILAPLRNTVAKLQQKGTYEMPELEGLTEQLIDFTELLNQAVTQDGTPPTGVMELLNRAQTQRSTDANAFVLDEAKLKAMSTQIRNAEAQIALVQDHLNSTFPEGSDSQLLNDDLKDAFEEFMLAPHGIIDEFRFKLRRIGKSK